MANSLLDLLDDLSVESDGRERWQRMMAENDDRAPDGHLEYSSRSEGMPEGGE